LYLVCHLQDHRNNNNNKIRKHKLTTVRTIKQYDTGFSQSLINFGCIGACKLIFIIPEHNYASYSLLVFVFYVM
jgi:hypothetical protein